MPWGQTFWFIMLLISEEEKHLGRKHLCRYLAFEKYMRKKKLPFMILQIIIKKLDDKSPRQVKLYGGNSPFMEKKYQNKYQSHVAYCYGYKLVCVVEKVKPFKSCLAEDTV